MAISLDQLRTAFVEAGMVANDAQAKFIYQRLISINAATLGADIQECLKAWEQTLTFFRATRPIMPSERLEMGRAIQLYGKDAVLLILLGVRGEKGSDSFDPSQYLSLTRIFSTKNAGRFASLGAQHQQKEIKRTETQAVIRSVQEPKQEAPEMVPTPMTPEAAALLESLGLRKPRGVI